MRIIVLCTLSMLATNLFSQSITSIQPESAEQGEFFSVKITGVDTRFQNYSRTYSDFSKDSTTIQGQGYYVIDGENYQVIYHIPADADTGLWDVNLTTPDITAVDAFRILPPSGNAVLTALDPRMYNDRKNFLLLNLGVRNLQENIPDLGGLQMILENKSNVISASSIYSPASDSLIGRFNFHNLGVSGFQDVILINDSDTLFSVNRGLQIGYPPAGLGIDSVSPGTLFVNETSGLRINTFGVNYTGSFYSNPTWIQLFKDPFVLYGEYADVVNSDELAVRFWLPPHAETGSWDLRIIRGSDTLMYFDAVSIQASDAELRMAPFEPDSGGQTENHEIIVHVKNYSVPTDLEPSDFWLSRESQVMQSSAIEVMDDSTFRVNFTGNLSDSLGLWDAYLVAGSDTLRRYNAFKLLKPVNFGLKDWEQLQLYAGESVLMTINGFNTHFLSIEAASDVYLSNVTETIQAVTIAKLSDTLMQAVFHIPQTGGLESYALYLEQSAQYGDVVEEDAVNLNSLGSRSIISSVSPQEAVQGENWLLTIAGMNTSFQQYSGSMSAQLVSSHDTLTGGTITVLNDSSMRVPVSIPGDAIPGFYDIHVIQSPGDTLVLYGGFEVEWLRKLLAVNPQYVLTGTRNIELEVKGLNLGLTEENSQWARVTLFDGVRTSVTGSNVEIVNSDSLTASVNVSNYTYIRDWTVEVDFGGGGADRQSWTLPGAIQVVDSIPNPIISGSLNQKPFFRLSRKGKKLSLEYAISQKGNVKVVIHNLVGVILETIDLGWHDRGVYFKELSGYQRITSDGIIFVQLKQNEQTIIRGKTLFLR